MNLRTPFVFVASSCALVLMTMPMGCPQAPAHPDAADGAQLATPESACVALARNGCAEGLSPHCIDVLAHVVDAGLTKVDLACMASATSKSAEQVCAGVVCE